MRKKLLLVLTLAALGHAGGLLALERPDVEFKIFQFPPDKIPRIDAKTDDWAIVPDSFTIGTDQLSDTVKGHGTKIDPSSLDVKVTVGWGERNASLVLPVRGVRQLLGFCPSRPVQRTFSSWLSMPTCQEDLSSKPSIPTRSSTR